MNGLILLSFVDKMVELWHNLFQGEKKLIFFVGFCMLTFAVPFFLIWLSGGLIELYFYMVLRKKYPVKWESMKAVSKTKGINYYYKRWLKREINTDNPFCNIWHVHDLFGKLCLRIWFAVILIVGMAVLIKQINQ